MDCAIFDAADDVKVIYQTVSQGNVSIFDVVVRHIQINSISVEPGIVVSFGASYDRVHVHRRPLSQVQSFVLP